MNKMNKKGFTLIEMLVVIAIIAVLVSIIIPTVTSATDKAGAATNAANLRSLVAEATTKYLSADSSTTGNVTLTFTNGQLATITVTGSAPLSQKVGDKIAKNYTAQVVFDKDAGQFVAMYGTYDVASFAAVAGGDKAPAEMEVTSYTSGTGDVASAASALKS